MKPKDLFTEAMDAADNCLRHIDDDQLGSATPCTEWDLRALIKHMTYEVLWVPDMLAGKTIEEVGDAYEGDILGEDWRESWRRAAEAARRAVAEADPDTAVHTSFGVITAEEYITQVGADVYVHTWDADQSTKCSLRFEPAAAQAMYDYYAPRAEAWRSAGAFGPAAEVSADAPLGDRLLALLGRRQLPLAVG